MNCRGFTLIEFLVATTLLAVLVGLGAPTLAHLQRSLRASDAMSRLTMAIATARIEAVRLNTPVTVCPSLDGRECSAGLGWERGFLVFADPDRTAQPAGESAVLQRFEALGHGLDARATAGRPYIRFQPSGWAAGTNASIRLCDRAARRFLGTVILNNAGRARVERPSAPLPCPYSG